MKKIISAFIVLFCMAGVSQAATTTSTQPTLLKAKEAIAHADFTSAEKIIAEYIQTNSRDPYGYLMRGIMNDWRQIVTGQYHALDEMIFEDFERARILAQVAWDEDQNNLAKKITLGHSLMYVSKKMIDRGQNFRAGGYLKRAKDIMTYVQMQEPNNPEVDLALGVFHYFSANVPKNLRWAATLLGFSGDAKFGLECMRRASQYNNFSQFDAQYLYMYMLFKHEKNYSQALLQNDLLKNKYPNNPEFEFTNAEIVYKMKNYKEALSLFEKFDAKCEVAKCALRYAFLSNYIQADIYKKTKDDANLSKAIGRALAVNNGQENSRAATLYKLAIQLDVKRGDQVSKCAHVKEIEKIQKYNVSIWNEVKTEHPECLNAQ